MKLNLNHSTPRSTARRNETATPLVVDEESSTAWMSAGNCRNYPPAVFFPSDGVGVDRARKICTDCPVATSCLEYALEQRIEHGVWGGCSERERRRILKRRRLSLTTS
jgi:WhiB family transcriptional regulator, redox-sensing transcriptional regulator